MLKKTFILQIIILLCILFFGLYKQFIATENSIIGTMLITFSIGIFVAPRFIEKMRSMQKYGQPIRLDGPESHILYKKNTPTIGGIFIILLSSFMGLALFPSSATLIFVFTLMSFGLLGFYDDYLKVTKNTSNGVSERFKLLFQISLAILISCAIYFRDPSVTNIYIPFYGMIDIGIYLFFPLSLFVIVGASNASNLTDGLDGLLSWQFIISALFFIFISFSALILPDIFTNPYYLFIRAYNFSDIGYFLLITISTLLVFLWFNAYPAKIFMGDCGSLALGGLLSAAALMLHGPILLAISAFIMVLETLSVLIQVGYFKYTKRKFGTAKRLFLMAPIHHHFEKTGLHENTVVIRFLIAAIILNLIATQI